LVEKSKDRAKQLSEKADNYLFRFIKILTINRAL
jgi:hypothetical protein